MLLQGMKGGWVVIEASHTVRSGLNVTCHMLTLFKVIVIIPIIYTIHYIVKFHYKMLNAMYIQ